LLSYREAEALPPGLKEVLLTPGAVITPLAQGHLKRQGIAVRFAAREAAPNVRSEGEWGFAIDDPSGCVEALRRGLLAVAEPWADVGPDVLAAARWVALGRDRAAVLITPEGSVAAWAANQIPGLRAASVHDPDATARASRQLGTNLLVVEPAGKSIAWLRQIIQTFRRAGTPKVPSWLTGGVTKP
jgi:hypothetical protein